MQVMDSHWEYTFDILSAMKYLILWFKNTPIEAEWM